MAVRMERAGSVEVAIMRRRDPRGRIAGHPTLGIQQLEPRLALAAFATPAAPPPDVVGPSVTAFTQPVVSGRKVGLTVSFNEPVTLRGAATIPYVFGSHSRTLSAAPSTWPTRVVSFADTVPADLAGKPVVVCVPNPGIVLAAGARVVDRAGNAAVSLAQPTKVVISGRSVAENEPTGTVVGRLGAVDADGPRDSLSYALVAGDGSGDNASFRIVAGRLVTAARFDYETRSSYSVRVRAADSGGLFAEASFRITVSNVPEAVVSGRVIDGFRGSVAGARVFGDTNGNHRLDWADANRNGSWDPGEGEVWTTATDNGRFSADFGSPTATIVSIGGCDPITRVAYHPDGGFLSAPAGSGVVSPLTTLVVAAAQAAPAGGTAAAQALVKAGLGLPAGIDLTTYDPLAHDDLAVQKAATAVANVMAAALQLGQDESAVLGRFVAVFAHASGPLDLADPAVVATIVGGTSAPGDVRMRLLAADNRQLFAAGSFAAVADVARTAQGDQVIVVDGTPAGTIAYEYDSRRNPLGLWFVPDSQLAGEDKDLLTAGAVGRVLLKTPADLAAKSVYRFTLQLYQYPGHGRPAISGEILVTLRVVPAA